MRLTMAMPDYEAVSYGVAARPLPGQVESGDQHAVITRPHGTLLAVVDGLGHGYEAALAARLAVLTLSQQAELPLLRLVERCHGALIRTRGVAMSVASLEWQDETMAWLAIGNVAGVLLRAKDRRSVEREHVLMRNGVIGHRLPPLRATNLRLHQGDLLIFATDGVREGFHNDVTLDARPQETADHILARYGKETDDALVLVGRWNGPPTTGATWAQEQVRQSQ
jgi:phosphoserine phosphatase RsbX